jgi:hypothetical protein
MILSILKTKLWHSAISLFAVDFQTTLLTILIGAAFRSVAAGSTLLEEHLRLNMLAISLFAVAI